MKIQIYLSFTEHIVKSILGQWCCIWSSQSQTLLFMLLIPAPNCQMSLAHDPAWSVLHLRVDRPCHISSQGRPVVNASFQTTVAESAWQFFFERKPFLSAPRFTLLLTDCDFKDGLWPFCATHVKKLCYCFPLPNERRNTGQDVELGVSLKLPSWSEHRTTGSHDEQREPEDNERKEEREDVETWSTKERWQERNYLSNDAKPLSSFSTVLAWLLLQDKS